MNYSRSDLDDNGQGVLNMMGFFNRVCWIEF